MNSKGPGIRFGIVAAVSLICGCTSSQTRLRISGSPGAQFTARYQSGELRGDITTTIRDGRPSIAVEAPGRDATFDVTKKDPASDLMVEVVQKGKTIYRVDLPPGTQRVRIFKSSGAWQQQPL